MVFPTKVRFGLEPVGTAVPWWCARWAPLLVFIGGDICEDHQYGDDHSPQEQTFIDISYFAFSFLFTQF